jgi:nicotinamide phosphoribosyltransferase
MAGVSIPAAEHSTITAWGRARERDAYRNFVEQFLGPGKYPIAACVSDSYDLWNALENIWCEELRELVETSGSTLVIRPDSGDPPEVNVRALKILERKVGCHLNTKGYKVLPHAFRLIQGDGNDDEEAIDRVLRAITSHRFSASNIAFGMGGGLLQRVHRDTQKMAFKLSEATIDDRAVPISKHPVTDTAKASKAGRLDLVVAEGRYQTVPGPRPDSALVTVFENGEIRRRWTFDEVRARAEAVLL